MTGTTLITGAAGLVGYTLIEALQQTDEQILASYFSPTINLSELSGNLELLKLDVTDRGAVDEVIVRLRPSTIYHLAAQSLPTVSWQKPLETMRINAGGTINLFEAIKAVRKGDPSYDPSVVVACSSAQYGASLIEAKTLIDETAAQLPQHPYGVSKVAQDLLTYQYWVNDRIRGIRARIFNTTGPRKRNDVVSDFSARAARITVSGEGPLMVGNLESKRAILDARDLVSALLKLSTRGRPGEAYNICAERAIRIGDLVPLLEKVAGRRFDLQVDPKLIRPSDEPIIIGSVERLMRDTGWCQTVPLETTIAEVYAYELKQLNA